MEPPLPPFLHSLAIFAPLLAIATAAKADICEHVPMHSQFLDDMTFCASSVLPPQGANTYGPANLGYLGPRDQAWCEGSLGDGLSESVTLHFRPQVHFQSLFIENGYQKNDSTYRSNNRVRHMTLRSGDGLVFNVALADITGQQRVALPRPVRTDWISLTIESVWPGERWQDTCISFIGPDLEELNYQGLDMD